MGRLVKGLLKHNFIYKTLSTVGGHKLTKEIAAAYRGTLRRFVLGQNTNLVELS